MTRFDNAMRFDRMMQRGEVSAGMLEDLAKRIASFHQDLPSLNQPQHAQAMADVIAGNRVDIEASTGTVFDRRDADALNEATEQAFETLRHRLTARQAWVRHCHGDLHSENIVYIDGAPVLFDCIEFNDVFAQIDCLYDIAFLVMDLCERGYQTFAWQIFNHYCDHLPQDDGLSLLPLFLSMRAAIRAKVEAFARHDDQALRYLKFAQETLHLQSPVLIAVGGLSGTGKSTISRLLAPDLGRLPGALHVRSDIERKRMFNTDFNSPLPERAYAPDVSDDVMSVLCKRAALALKAGQAVIVDMVFAKPQQRQMIEAVAGELGVAFHGFWLDAPMADRSQRVERRVGDVSDADQRVAALQEGFDLGEITWHRMDTTQSQEQVTEAIKERLR